MATNAPLAPHSHQRGHTWLPVPQSVPIKQQVGLRESSGGGRLACPSHNETSRGEAERGVLAEAGAAIEAGGGWGCVWGGAVTVPFSPQDAIRSVQLLRPAPGAFSCPLVHGCVAQREKQTPDRSPCRDVPAIFPNSDTPAPKSELDGVLWNPSPCALLP